MFTLKRFVLLAISTPLLVACHKAPSQQAILQAYQTEINQTNKMTQQYGTGLPPMVLNDVKKLRCSEFGNKGVYRCQVEIDTTLPMIGRTQNQTTLVLKPSGDGWQIDRMTDSADSH